MRAFLGILLGVVAAIAVQSALDYVASLIYPVAISNLLDLRAVSEAFASRPTGALLLNVLNFFLGGLAGGLVAARVSRRDMLAWIPGVILALMALVIVFAYPLPPWAWFASLAAPLIGAMVARHLAAPSSALPETNAA
jgi:hypothetical protein